MPRNSQLAKQEQAVTHWNAATAIGAKVLFRNRPGAKPEEFMTASEAFLLGGHTACVFLKDKSGCVALDACEKVG
jgi:hypothetical protein